MQKERRLQKNEKNEKDRQVGRDEKKRPTYREKEKDRQIVRSEKERLHFSNSSDTSLSPDSIGTAELRN
jgi:hypothetical protein